MASQTKPDTKLTALFRRKPRVASRLPPAAKFWSPLRDRRLLTTIINKTDMPIVLRAKYRDIWEGDRMQLEKEEGRTVNWTPELYRRLGAFVETDGGKAFGIPLYISNATMGENEEIGITGLSFKDALQLKKRSRKQANISSS